jgi:hypothetical protein
VNVDETRSHVEARHIDGLQRLSGRNADGHRRDFAILDRHVAHRAQVVPRVDDVTALQEKVVILRLTGGR